MKTVLSAPQAAGVAEVKAFAKSAEIRVNARLTKICRILMVMANNGIERWLLNLAATSRIAINTVLLSEDNLRLQWADYHTNMEGWAVARIQSAIFSLIGKSEIEIWSHDGDLRLLSLTSDIQKMIEENNVSSNISIGLSKKGIDRWIELFRPDWSKFYEMRFYSPEQDPEANNIVLISGSSSQRYELFAASLDYYGFDKTFGFQSVKMGTRKNWQATYWRQFTCGFYARAKVRQKPQGSIRDSDADHLAKYFDQPWLRNKSNA